MPSLAEEISRETDRILLKLIDKAAREAEEEIEKTGTLSMEHAIPLLLKSQYNHILHLDEELVSMRKIMDERFTTMNVSISDIHNRISDIYKRISDIHKRISDTDKKISDLYKWMFGCFIGTVTILGGLMSFLKFFVK